MKKASFVWPLHATPRIHNAVRVPFSPQNLSREYQHPTFALHQHGYHARLWIGRKCYPIRPGDITITPPHTISRYELEEAGYHWCIHFYPAAISGKKATFTLPLHIPIKGEDWGITERMQSISEIYGVHQSKREDLLRSSAAGAALQALLLRLAIYSSGKKQSPHRYVRRSDSRLDDAKKTLDEQFNHRIEVSELAKSSHLSRNYFSTRFRERFGMTVDAYLLRRRIEMARHLLITTPLSVKEIAFECGIPDPHYFNKQFRHSAGISPSEYRVIHS